MLMFWVYSRSFEGLEFFIPDFDHSAAAGSAYTWEANIRHHRSGINTINLQEGSRDRS